MGFATWIIFKLWKCCSTYIKGNRLKSVRYSNFNVKVWLSNLYLNAKFHTKSIGINILCRRSFIIGYEKSGKSMHELCFIRMAAVLARGLGQTAGQRGVVPKRTIALGSIPIQVISHTAKQGCYLEFSYMLALENIFSFHSLQNLVTKCNNTLLEICFHTLLDAYLSKSANNNEWFDTNYWSPSVVIHPPVPSFYCPICYPTSRGCHSTTS